MLSVKMDKTDELVMKLIHYFITVENYRPMVVNGVQNEVWLENLDSNIPIIRININYIHNNEQLKQDTNKVNFIKKRIQKSTFSFKLNILNILVNAREDINVEESKNIETIRIDKINDLKKNSIINEYFPNFKDKVNSKRSNFEEMMLLTEEVNKKTVKEDKKMAKMFSKTNKPIVTYALIYINVVMFLLTILNYEFMIETFANYYKVVQEGEVYRLLTSAFMHGNIYHLFFNMYALYFMGSEAERHYGKVKYLIIYLISAVIGGLFSNVLSSSVSVGASGAIFGLFGAELFFAYKYRATLSGFLKSGILPVLLLNLILGFMIPGIDVWDHIGGLNGGLLVAFSLGVNDKEKLKDKVNGTIVLGILIMFLIYMLINK